MVNRSAAKIQDGAEVGVTDWQDFRDQTVTDGSATETTPATPRALRQPDATLGQLVDMAMLGIERTTIAGNRPGQEYHYDQLVSVAQQLAAVIAAHNGHIA